MSGRTTLDSGALVIHEPAETLPLCHVTVSLRTGSATDPDDRRGQARLMARMLRMGAPGLSAHRVEQALDAMGAQLSIGVGPAFTHISAVVVERNVEPLLQLLGRLLREPAFRASDLRRLKDETRAGLAAGLDDDGLLAGRHFRAFCLPDHPYGRGTVGTEAGLLAVRDRHLRDLHRDVLVGGNVIFGLAGGLPRQQVRALFEQHFGWLPPGSPPPALCAPVPAPKLPRGRRILVIDKPERTQTQILVGTLGTRARDRDHTALLVADTAFGGLFTSRLTTEVRGKRGYSYGASSGFGQQPQRDLWSMRTAPAADDAVDCLRLQLSLYDAWVQGGVSGKELSVARNYLRRSVAFHSDTAAKRIDQRVDVELFGLPRGYHSGFAARVSAVGVKEANAAIRKRMSPRDLSMTLVATADRLLPALEKIPGIDALHVAPFDSEPGAAWR